MPVTPDSTTSPCGLTDSAAAFLQKLLPASSHISGPLTPLTYALFTSDIQSRSENVNLLADLSSWFSNIYDRWPLDLKVNSTPGNRLYDPDTRFISETNVLFWTARTILAEKQGTVVIPRANHPVAGMIRSVISVYYGVTLLDDNNSALSSSSSTSTSSSSRSSASSSGGQIASIPKLNISIPAAFWKTPPDTHLSQTSDAEREVIEDLREWVQSHRDRGVSPLTGESIWAATSEIMRKVDWEPAQPGDADVLGRLAKTKPEPVEKPHAALQEEEQAQMEKSQPEPGIAKVIELARAVREDQNDPPGEAAETLGTPGPVTQAAQTNLPPGDLFGVQSPDRGREVESPAFLSFGDSRRIERDNDLWSDFGDAASPSGGPDITYDHPLPYDSDTGEPQYENAQFEPFDQTTPKSAGTASSNVKLPEREEIVSQIGQSEGMMDARSSPPLSTASRQKVPVRIPPPATPQAGTTIESSSTAATLDTSGTYTGPARCGRCCKQQRTVCVVSRLSSGNGHNKCEYCEQTRSNCDLNDPYIRIIGRPHLTKLCRELDWVIDITGTTQGLTLALDDERVSGFGDQTGLAALGYDSAKIAFVTNRLEDFKRHMREAGKMARVYGVSHRAVQEGLTEEANRRVNFPSGEWGNDNETAPAMSGGQGGGNATSGSAE